MARMAAAGFWSRGRACARTARLCLGGWLLLIGLTSVAFGQNEPVKGEATFSASGGFARLVLKLAEDVESQVSTAGSILVIRFRRPVDIPVDRLSDAVPDYVGSVRRDPDGTAIRLSLSRKVTVNTMTAGERVFVDLLPDTWSGQPPALPAEVVRELSERARVAERALRQQRATQAAQKRPPIRVRASVQPTFVRFVFEMPDGVSVSSVLNDQRLSLLFNAALSFDLADAKLALPPNIASIGQKIESETSLVEVVLIGDVDVRSFREEKNYIIDVAFQQAEKTPAPLSPVADASRAPAPAASVRTAEPPASRRPGEVAPLTSETFARQANIEIRPDQPATAAPGSEPPPAPQSNAMPMQAAAAVVAAPEKSTTAAAAPPPETPKVAQAPANVSPEVMASPPVNVNPPALDPPPTVQAPPAGPGPATVTARRDSDALRVTFAFAAATPAAMFRRADTVWLVFDSLQSVDVDMIRSRGGALIADVSRLPLDTGQAIRIRLNRPQMPSLTGDDKGGAHWTLTFADTMQSPQLPLAVFRNITDPARANVTVPLARPGLLHRLIDPEAGDTLLVVTASLPVRGLIKQQDFVEMSLLESIHGVAVHPNSEDVVAEVAPDRVIIGRPGGLTLSSADVGSERATTAVRPIFDVAEWRKNQAGGFIARQDELIAAAGTLEPAQRTQARIDLARFLMSRGMYWEAKGAADLALADAKPGSEDSIALMVRVVANILIGRPEQGLKDLANPVIGANYDSQLWKALALARQGKWAEAREKFKNVEFAITSLPIELQRIVISDAMRASLEVRDFSGAAKRGSDLQVVGVPPEMKAATAVLFGRLAEALGHDKDAQSEYRVAIESSDRAAAAEARLLDIILRQRRDETNQTDALRELETLSVLWRGDAVEVRALQMMARIYTDIGRYGESLAAARAATRLQPNSEISRASQDASAALFAQIFLSPKGDDLPPVEALAMFYEYSELTPIGRRGDEMIRRLADRLVAVDLLDQAAELLQYQVDRRLEGAARAQVAARLAMVYLTARKPDRAISALRTTRIADLSGELRTQRLLLESRAQSDVGRHALALDIISNITGREAIRLRSDIQWASRNWRESAEQIELYYADRWRDFRPLNPVEKGDVIRAVVGYALAEDAIGLARFREKYAPLMSGEADRAAFETASKSSGASSAEFALIAKMAASVDTLDGFLREMKVRFPDATARAPLSPETAKGEPVHTGALPRIIGLTRADAKR
ncbi:tetratricopeptide repeat protein [Bradyrhizobium sp.]|uniref:tetratricopeptide repeat protein n=1 Tax=Bradyrhizobium sp. TaxID=376 RepID=UPI00273504EB|nr:tetratricopeptide repeat protein [Bradyrhizobium sp.]MDP3690754.1 tetratricopeptide repeat protein [Bradyrhizobium sp.]